MKTYNSNYLSRLLVVICLLSVAAFARADQAQFVNAKLEARPATQGLQKTVTQITSESQQPQWIAYEVQSISPKDHTCCDNSDTHGWSGTCGTCSLEQQHGNVFVQGNRNAPVPLEGPVNVTVLLRADHGHVMRIRIASSDCSLDAGGLRVVWLTGVKPEESVAYLTQFVNGKMLGRDEQDDMSQQALMAIAQHADASADRAYAGFVAPDQPPALREKASFWLGAARGKTGFAVLQKMAKDDPSPDVRDKVAFALFVSHEPSAVDEIVRMAKDDPSAHVRGQALFWLAQKAGQRASSTITGVIQNDPDTEVKKKAVFALSQMPKDEGVPKLIEVAQTNRNPDVRKQAMFWLGQSNDPRALAFFEKILGQ